MNAVIVAIAGTAAAARAAATHDEVCSTTTVTMMHVGSIANLVIVLGPTQEPRDENRSVMTTLDAENIIAVVATVESQTEDETVVTRNKLNVAIIVGATVTAIRKSDHLTKRTTSIAANMDVASTVDVGTVFGTIPITHVVYTNVRSSVKNPLNSTALHEGGDTTNITLISVGGAVAAIESHLYLQFYQRPQTEDETVTGITRGELTMNNATNTTEVCTVIETNYKATTTAAAT